MHDKFDSISPIDYRYADDRVTGFLSENAATVYKLRVELALVTVLNRRGICSNAVLGEVKAACGQVTTAEVYEEEDRVRHDVRALVNCIRAKVSDDAKPFIHMTATSFDIIDTANAARYKDVVEQVLIPSLTELEGVLAGLSIREAATVQIGRTHGQHAVPITFGFAVSGYVSRLGRSIEKLRSLAQELVGKFSGAVGAYNASSLSFDDPEKFEAEVLAELGLEPAEHSTQIVPPEALTRLLCEVTIAAGILANLSDDMRHLQRTEIGEVGEAFEAAQVGSSTMPQKRNPINFENAKSLWKVIVPRMLEAFMAIAFRIQTVFEDQISEHQRDLTNSASARTDGEIIAYAVSITKRLTRTMKKLVVDRDNLERNLGMQRGLVLAEPLYIILAGLGHPDAHEKVRVLTLHAQREKQPLEEIVVRDEEMKGYLDRMTSSQRRILSNPSLYTGIAAKKAHAIAERWKRKLGV
ncbi:MAG TPA: lyase family protein [Candidatus Paceibacterota bacterium]|jgi:adenylosuccinate lyase|nr:lyase family protein [Candidatus Paceibacterota bacterium]